MSTAEHIGEFEQLVLLALLRLCREAYSATIRQEIRPARRSRGFDQRRVHNARTPRA